MTVREFATLFETDCKTVAGKGPNLSAEGFLPLVSRRNEGGAERGWVGFGKGMALKIQIDSRDVSLKALGVRFTVGKGADGEGLSGPPL